MVRSLLVVGSTSMRGGFCGLLGVWLLACAGSSDTQVRVCGDLQIPGDADALRVSLRDEIFNELRAGVVDLVDDEGVRALPVTVELPSSNATRWVSAVALLEGVEVARFDRHTGALSEGAEVDLALTSVCYRLTCPRGQTCLDGACDTAPGPSDPPGCGP
jgi:hypothetical protein